MTTRGSVLGLGVVLLLVPVVIAGAFGALSGSSPGISSGALGITGPVGLTAAARQAGFHGQALRVAVAVGLAESGGDPTAKRPNPPTPGCLHGSLDRGGWQLNDCYHAEVTDACAYHLSCAAREAYRISAGGADWTSWTTFISGAWRAQLAAAVGAIATLDAASTVGGIPPGYGTPGPCGLARAADYTRHLVTELFGITDIGECALFTGHIPKSDHYPDANGQAHAIDVMVGTDTALGWQVAEWAAANAAALHIKYVLFAGEIIDFREPVPSWHACRDPTSSCATEHSDHVHVSTR